MACSYRDLQPSAAIENECRVRSHFPLMRSRFGRMAMAALSGERQELHDRFELVAHESILDQSPRGYRTLRFSSEPPAFRITPVASTLFYNKIIVLKTELTSSARVATCH